MTETKPDYKDDHEGRSAEVNKRAKTSAPVRDVDSQVARDNAEQKHRNEQAAKNKSAPFAPHR